MLPEIRVLALGVFLVMHGLVHFQGWYYKYPRVDMITHFFGGLALGGFVKQWDIGIAIIVGWEVLESLLARDNSKVFKENLMNKISDVFFGLLGFYFGMEML